MDTNKMRDISREQFEKFALSAEGGLFAGHLAKGEDGEYLNYAAQCYWLFWQASRAASWQPMESCPKHVEVLFYREDCGVISGQLTCADTFMTDKDRETGDYSEEEQYSEDAWCYGPDGVERLDGDLVPTHWMPYPAEPEVTP
ncbi:MAG TPA: hypothetical protein VES70_33460 [Pseudomonas sp.]|nr:hypothetical protein [Pseudomonas sp.]